jgi:hypothetical protein
MQQENWINEVFESTKGMRKAEPSPFLFEQISTRIQMGREVVQAHPFLKWGLTSLVLIILSLNMISIANNRTTEVASQETSDASADPYFNNATIYNY